MLYLEVETRMAGTRRIKASGTSPRWKRFAERWCETEGWRWRWVRVRRVRGDVVGEWKTSVTRPTPSGML